MANQYVNKVEYGSDTLIDLTSDTVTASTLLSGYTAHDRSGAPIVGVAVSGGYTVNFSTTNPDLYGATITIKQGSTVIGTVAFDNTGSASYTLSNPGTYTWSVTLEGETYTDTFVVAAPEVYIETTFVYRDWLVAGGLNPSDYADLPAVLSDEDAVRQLMTIHAAVDYLASFDSTDASVVAVLNDNYAAKWISLTDYAEDVLEAAYGTLMGTIGKYGYGEWGITDATTTPPTWGALGNVPVMTGNSAPYGTAICSDDIPSWNAYRWSPFDGNSSTYWQPDNASMGAGQGYVGYSFANPVCVKRVYYDVEPAATGTGVFTVALEATNDISGTWTELKLLTFNVTTATDRFTDYADLDDNETFYLHYRWRRVAVPATTRGRVFTLQFYGRTLRVSVPKMSGNTTPYGVASLYRGWSDNTNAYKCFDQNTSTSDYSQTKNTVNSDVGRFVYEFPSPVAITMVAMMDNAFAYDANLTGNIQYSDDGTTWTNTNVTLALANTVKTAVLSAIGAHKFWGVYFNTGKWLANHSVYSVTVTTLNFFGEDYSEREWDTSHPRRYLYDHGIEVETFDAACDTSVKLPNCYQIGTPSSNPSNMYGMWSTTDTIDLTNYSRMMMSAGLNFYRGAASGNYVVQLQGNTSKTGYNSGRVFVGLTAYGESPFYHGVDISSVNQSLYPNICASSAGCKADITEWWLE